MSKKTNHQDNLDLKKIVIQIKRHWVLFAFSVAATMLYAVFYNATTTPVYQVSSSILINNEDESMQGPGGQLGNVFRFFGNSGTFENELEVLKSTVVIKEALANLNFNISYFEKKLLSKAELYKTSPFVLVFKQDHPQPIGVTFMVKIEDDSSFTIRAKGEDITLYVFNSNEVVQTIPKFKMKMAGDFGQTLKSDQFDFKLIKNKNVSVSEYENKKFYFVIQNPRSLIRSYKNKLNIIPINKESSIAKISLKTTVPNKAIDFINSLTNTYLLQDQERNVFISMKTIDYIDRQLNIIKDSLSIAEDKLQIFRTNNQVMDITTKTGRIYTQMQELETERAAIEVKKRYFQYLNDYFKQNEAFTELIAPSSMGISDPLQNNMIQELISLNAEKVSLIENNQEKSPYLRTLNIRIENLKNTITENIKYSMNANEIDIQEIDSRINRLNTEINKLPRTERELVGIERKFNLNDNIYTFLLQKRSEAEIAKASNLPNAEIIEPADRVGDRPYSPKKGRNYFLALFLGILTPMIYIGLKDVINDKVSDSGDIKAITEFPVVGTVPHMHRNQQIKRADPKSIITEVFRKIRTNLEFFSDNSKCEIILVTSTIAGEGKTFVCGNLAMVYALLGKKTLVIGLDLRRPSLNNYFEHDKTLGVSSYLINKASIEEIISKSTIDNLDIITSGEIPPNPTELIASKNTTKLFEHLTSCYDYIIIDSPPIGIVPDAYLLMKYSSVNLFVVRHKYSLKRHINRVFDELSNKKISNVSIVYNDERIAASEYKYEYKYKSKE